MHNKKCRSLTNNCVPGNLPPISRRYGHGADHDQKPEQSLGATSTSVISRLRGNHGANQENGEGNQGAKRLVESLGDHLIDSEGSMAPDEFDGHHGIFDGNPEEDETKSDAQIQQERDQPVLLMPKTNEPKNPPSG